jgi:hypothetical protein
MVTARAASQTSRVRESSKTLLLIALFKLVKGILLVDVGVGALKLLHRDVADTVIQLYLGAVGSEYTDQLVCFLFGQRPDQHWPFALESSSLKREPGTCFLHSCSRFEARNQLRRSRRRRSQTRRSRASWPKPRNWPARTRTPRRSL